MRVKLQESHVVIVDFEVYRAGTPVRYQQITCTYQTKTAHKLLGNIKTFAKDNVPNFDVDLDSIRITNIMRLT